MLGYIKFPKDYSPNRNRYGEKYVSLATFFIAIVLFTFIIYLLPGLFGAPLKGVSGFLPSA
jgi:thiol:disulfide interchange protein DsbD